MNSCTQWSPVFTVVFTIILRFNLRVWKVNAYLEWVDAQGATAVTDRIYGTTGSG
jgi:hypothetical protein